MAFVETENFRQLKETYYKMQINSTGITLKKLTTQLQIFRDNFNLNVEEYCIVIMHFTEAILHYSLATTYESDCLTQISIEELRKCREMVAEIKSKITFSHGFDDNFADRWLEALEAVKNLEVTVSIINIKAYYIYICGTSLLQRCLPFCTLREKTTLGCLCLV